MVHTRASSCTAAAIAVRVTTTTRRDRGPLSLLLLSLLLPRVGDDHRHTLFPVCVSSVRTSFLPLRGEEEAEAEARVALCCLALFEENGLLIINPSVERVLSFFVSLIRLTAWTNCCCLLATAWERESLLKPNPRDGEQKRREAARHDPSVVMMMMMMMMLSSKDNESFRWGDGSKARACNQAENGSSSSNHASLIVHDWNPGMPK
jgi:hypothetical protein